jgi:hypothetical protein
MDVVVLDAADEKYAIVAERTEHHAVVSASCHTPALEFESQRLGHRVRIGWQRCGDELGDSCRYLVWQAVERAESGRRQLHRP